MPPIGRRTLLRTVLSGVLGAAAAGCGGSDGSAATGGTVSLLGGPLPQGRPPVDLSPGRERPGRRVVMIGDSITVASTPSLEAAARPLRIDFTIDAEVGRRIARGNGTPGVDVLAEVLENGVPDLVVVALGTNDITASGTAAEYEAMIAELLGLLPEEVPVLWIDIYLDGLPEASATFNRALLAVLRRRGNAAIGRWAAIAATDGVLSDGVHPTNDGEDRFSELVIGEIDNWLG